MEKITMSDVSLPTGELWLDSGILFPFFNTRVKTNYVLWVEALIDLSRRNSLFTTTLVKKEIFKVFTRWSPENRKKAAGLYRKLFDDHMTIKDIFSESSNGLTDTDMSLKNRPGGILITADRLLYESDSSSAVFVSLEELDLGYSYQLNIKTKNIQ